MKIEFDNEDEINISFDHISDRKDIPFLYLFEPRIAHREDVCWPTIWVKKEDGDSEKICQLSMEMGSDKNLTFDANWCGGKLTEKSMQMAVKKSREKIKGDKCYTDMVNLVDLKEKLEASKVHLIYAPHPKLKSSMDDAFISAWKAHQFSKEVVVDEDRKRAAKKILDHYNIRSPKDIITQMRKHSIPGYKTPKIDDLEPLTCRRGKVHDDISSDEDAQEQAMQDAYHFESLGFKTKVVKNPHDMTWDKSDRYGKENYCIFITGLPE